MLTLDYPGKQLRLARGELPAANNANILPFENPHVIPIVEVSIGNLKMKAHIDSGNMVGKFILPTALVDKLKLAWYFDQVAGAYTFVPGDREFSSPYREDIPSGSRGNFIVRI